MKCTYCGGTKFYEGPSGGMAVNVLCANPKCRHWFNDMGSLGFDDLYMVEPTEEEKDTEKEQQKQSKIEHEKSLHDEGFSYYKTGDAFSLVTSDNYQAGEYIIKDNIFRLSGWLDALHDDIKRAVHKK